MTPKKPMPPSPYADIRTVGIPRALMFYRYETLWTSFFEAIGVRVVTSEPSERAMLERGDALSMDECCLASKLYMGHADSLMGACDAIFVPSLANLGRFKSFCTKFQALPDLVRNTFYDTPPRIVSCLVEEQESSTSMQDAFIEMGMKFGCTKHDAKQAWKEARKASKNERKNAERALDAKLDELRRRKKKADTSRGEKAPLAILVVAHPYVAKDPLMGKGVVDALEELGATVLFAQDFDREKALEKSFEFSATLPWIVNRELIGALLCLHEDIDGVVLISAFPCGPDSMTNDAVARCIKGKPMLSLTVDAQSGTAGLETRIESFIDILTYQREGGYLR
ncbi:acyl-CoA dehydratase activase-related protein [Slackia piriformis]|uniref:DUF2229 domain-containing protein n=1 Tax=Slackia piriformis YIT 12062 TaxID=742818 RepID=K0YKW1_9ACTN|nr:acyl-CoA dehydratase activase-related protein [Slackia piriformis]EJZ84267.1 hypothetical protein HMPREF9451_00576 [Slackia piriformis YIT 12062]